MRVSLMALLTGIQGSSEKKQSAGKKKGLFGKLRISPVVGALFLIAFLGLYISGVLSFIMMDALHQMHMEIVLFLLMGMMTIMMGVLYTSYSIKNAVYSGDDNDLLLSMPVSETVLMLSRVSAIYLESLLLCFFFMAPAGAIYTWFMRNSGENLAAFWIRLLLVIIFLPFLDTTLSMLFGALLAWVSSRFTKRSYGQTIIYGVFLAVVFYFSFHLSDMVNHIAENADVIRKATKWFAAIGWMADGIMGSWTKLLYFALICIVPFILMVVILGKLYKKAISSFSSQKARNDYHLHRQHNAGAVRALLSKESQRFFGSAVYFWNAALGMVMLAGMGIVLLLKRNDIRKFLGDIVAELAVSNQSLLLVIGIGIIGLVLSMNMIAAPSISLEGKNFWILREAPVESRTILAVKTGFEVLVSLPFLLIMMICIGLSGLMQVPYMALLALFALLFQIGHACFGMLVGLKFARMDQPNEAQIIKRSMVAFLAPFGSGALFFLFGILGFFAAEIFEYTTIDKSMIYFWMGFAFLFALISALVLHLRGEKMLNRL